MNFFTQLIYSLSLTLPKKQKQTKKKKKKKQKKKKKKKKKNQKKKKKTLKIVCWGNIWWMDGGLSGEPELTPGLLFPPICFQAGACVFNEN